MPAVEVCVVAYRNADTIGALIDSLRLVPDLTLALHDNGPGGETLEVARRHAEAANLSFRGEVCPRGNCGFAAGCNSLAASSAADDLLFLNPDAVIVSWPPALRAQGRIVGPVVRNPSGELAHVWGTRRMLRDELMLRWARRAPRRPRGHGYVSGAALLVERRTFESLHGFDEGFFMYYEDIDLCRRAIDVGVPVVLEDSWVVVHTGGHSVGRSAESLTRAFVTSYESGRRFHELAGHSLHGFDLLTATDSGLRAVAFRLLPRRRAAAKANGTVARIAVGNLLRAFTPRE